jgi:hypothetical protein
MQHQSYANFHSEQAGQAQTDEQFDYGRSHSGLGQNTCGRVDYSDSTSSRALCRECPGVRLLATCINWTSYFPLPVSFARLIYPEIFTDNFVSSLPEILSMLLRNDSVTDWALRSDAYHAMIVLLRRMVDCELTVECLIQQRWEKSKSCGLEAWMWDDGEITWAMEKDEHGASVYARDPPLFDNFKRLNKQCEAFLAGASRMMMTTGEEEDDEDAEDMVQATSICGDITAAKDDIERAMMALGRRSSADYSGSTGTIEDDMPMNKGKGKGRDPAVDMEKAYSIDCERLAFKHVDTLSGDGRQGFGPKYANYNYAGQLEQTVSATRNPKDRLHLIKELAVMATCLPPGVWVRVDEVRHDAM